MCTSSFPIRIALFILFSLALCLIPAGRTSAAEIVVALSPESVDGAQPILQQGVFALDELEAVRLTLRGGPPEPVFPGHSRAHTRDGAHQDKATDLSLLFAFEVPESTNLLDAAYKLSKLPGVEWAEPIFDLPMESEDVFEYPRSLEPPSGEYQLESTGGFVAPNDPLFAEQNSLMQMHCPEAWTISTGSTEVVICAVDGGYYADHPDLIGSLWDNPEESLGPQFDTNGYPGDTHGWNFSQNTPDICDTFLPFIGHGVACTSVYSARGNNGIGIAGILWDATVMATVYEYQPPQLMGAKNAVYAVDNGASVLQASFGGYSRCSKTGEAAFKYAREKGLLAFAVAGNAGVFLPVYPGAYPDVLAVSGVDRKDVITGSNFGHWPNVSAPLDGSVTCTLEGGYGAGGGTSVATPHAAGVGALLLSVHPDWDPDLAEAHLRATATPVDVYGVNIMGEQNGFESGPRVDAYAALSTEPRVEFSVEFCFLRPDEASGRSDQVELVLELENTWKEASNVELRLSCDDPLVSVISDHCYLGDMRPLEVKRCGSGSFVISVSEECPQNHRCTFYFDATADGLEAGQRFPVDLAVNSGIHLWDGWPNDEFHAYSYPPMRADLNGDGLPEIVCPTGMGHHVYSIEGELIDEIPVVPTTTAPAIADLDGDLADELIFSDYMHGLHLFDYELGVMTLIDRTTGIPHLPQNRRYHKISVSTAELKDHSGKQIVTIFSSRDNPYTSRLLGVFSMDGTLVDGFPFEHPIQSANVAVADFDGEAGDEIAFVAAGAFYVVDNQGQTLSGWPHEIADFQPSDVGPEIEVSTGDLDGDGWPELLGTVGDTRVFALNHDGTAVTGWPYQGTAMVEAHPVIADLTGDGMPEVVLLECAPPHNPLRTTGGIIHVLSASGNELPGWPTDTGCHGLRPPIACDVNGDGKQEVLVTSTKGVFAFDESGQLLDGWPIVISSEALGTCAYAEVSADDFDGDGKLDLGIPMEGHYFICSLDSTSEGGADWGYRGRGADMRFSAEVPALGPSVTIRPQKRTFISGLDSLYADIRLANPGPPRSVLASAWVEVMGLKLFLPGFTVEEQHFALTLPRHSLFELTDIINLSLPEDLPSVDVEIRAELVDPGTSDVLSSALAEVEIRPYTPPSGDIVVEGLIGACWQTFSYQAGPSSFEPTPLWVFDDGATSTLESPGHLFTTPGEHLLGLILTDDVGTQYLATTSTLVFEQAGHCPQDMANAGSFCIDRFEASRPDATAYSRGSVAGPAISASGLLPWQPEGAVEAITACALAGKRLCTSEEWRGACKGSFGLSDYQYPYGNEWEYMACSDYSSYMDGVVITGKFPRCVSRIGVWDMIGNVRELTTDADGIPALVAGGTTYTDPYYPTCETSQIADREPWGRGLAYGFRCCRDPEQQYAALR